MEDRFLSQDGTGISYRHGGEGPGLLLVYGALSTSEDLMTLAEALAPHFHVFILERRGRGRSGPQGSAYSLASEVDDLVGLQRITQAGYVFAHSYGGLIVLEAARLHPVFARIALFEPGISLGDAWDWMEPYRVALARGDKRGAFVRFVQGEPASPLQKLPTWWARWLLTLLVRGRRWEKMRELLTENLREHEQVRALQTPSADRYTRLHLPVLVLAGGKSSRPVQERCRWLQAHLPQSELRFLEGLDHFALEKSRYVPRLAALLEAYFGPGR
jgi:pimeloyl-ACP methyl ester carboxylesterase